MITLPEIRNPLKLDGVHQDKRLESGLNPESIRVEERTEADFLQFAETFSNAVQFYDLNDIPQGNWEVFFAENIAEDNPQRSLFIAFLRMLHLLHGHTDTLTQRHLDYYYREVLDFEPLGAKPSQVHLYLELAQNLESFLVREGTEVSAGQDESGVEILFRLVRELVVNNVRVAAMKTVFREDTATGNRLYAAPIANSKDGQGASLDDENAGWNAFGESQLLPTLNGNRVNRSQRTMEDARIGFAIASPYFRMEEGERTLNLNLFFEKNVKAAPPQILEALKISYSHADDWVPIPTNQISLSRHGKTLKFEIQLKMQDPAWNNYDPATHGGNMDTIYPLLKFEFQHDPTRPEYFGYAALKGLKIEKFTLQTTVIGVRSLLVQNDYAGIDVAKPFQPFGPVPGVGDSLYIGHPEIFRHAPEILHLNIEWKEVPTDDFGDHYSAYHPDIQPNAGFNEQFAFRVDWLEDRNWMPAVDPDQPLFATDPRDPQRFSVRRSGPPFLRKRNERSLTGYDYSVPYGFLRLRFTGPNLPYFKGFGHQRYPVALSNADPDIEVQPPYTPEILSLSLDYKTDPETVDLKENGAVRTDRLFHLGPFGEGEIHADILESHDLPLVPQFDHEGYLYLGLADVQAPQSVAVLFQLAQGSGVAEKSKERTEISWQYLAGDVWMELDALRISSDSSRSLLHTGVITFDLPETISLSHTLMPTGLAWLRARIPEGAEGIDRVEGIHTQAIAADFFEQGNDADLLRKRLEPGLIKKLKTSNTVIRKVVQPYSSFDGGPPENTSDFYTRVSERLRHKDRGIMIWDYERMVMQEFDGIYKVKCLNHTNDITELQPGSVRVIVVPDLRNHHARNPFQPKAGKRTLLDIQEYLGERITPFIDLKVENPLYEQIRLHFNVGFHAGYDEGYYGKQLHSEVQRFLSPWAFEEGEDIIFGGKVYKSSILKFIEDRPYVDFVNGFSMFHLYPDPEKEEAWQTRVNNGTLIEVFPAHSIVRFEHLDVFGRTLRAEIDARFFHSLHNGTTSLETQIQTDLLRLFERKDEKQEEITQTYLVDTLRNFHYVDALHSVQLYYSYPGGIVMEDVETAHTKTAKSIIVSALSHRVGVYRAGDFACEGSPKVGIGYMVMDADFIIT